MCRLVESQQAQKRRGNRALRHRGPTGLKTAALERLGSRTPPPDVAAIVADEIERLLNCLEEPLLRQIVDQKLEGWTNREIATQAGLSIRTIERKLQRVRALWNEITTS